LFKLKKAHTNKTGIAATNTETGSSCLMIKLYRLRDQAYNPIVLCNAIR